MFHTLTIIIQITNICKNMFCTILNANTCDCDLKNEIMAKIENIQHMDDMTISAGDDATHLKSLRSLQISILEPKNYPRSSKI